MRRRTLILGVVALGSVAVACADIFHDTDAPTLCDVDAAAPGCTTPAVDGGSTDICAPDHATAEARAKHACAWLAACETAIGKNATGECMAEAILAYDCQANPNRRPKLKAKAFWTTLANVKSCDDVDNAVFPEDKPTTCLGAGFVGCTKWFQTTNLATRIACPTKGQRYFGENCILQGRTCDSIPPNDAGGGNNTAGCLGAKGRNCKQSPGCEGSNLVVCDDAGLDRGLDCSLFGKGECSNTGAAPACVPEGPSKAALPDIKCTAAGEAQSTVSGVLESVDCTYVSGPAPGNCTEITNPPLGTPAAAACKRTAGCGADSCNADKLVACVGGRSVTIDCIADGLKGCNDTLNTLEGVRASCVKP
jgi:hypothetical protein